MDGAAPGRPERGGEGPDGGWARAALAATLLKVDPSGLHGILLRAQPSPTRAAWLERVLDGPAKPSVHRRLPLAVDDATLLGGLDLPATLVAGRPVVEPGLLARLDGGLLLIPLAERMSPAVAARVVGAIDRREVALEREGLAARIATRFCIVAFDEGIGDERAPDSLGERLAFLVEPGAEPRTDESPLESRFDIESARERLPGVECPEEVLVSLCATAAALGIDSLRAPLLALQAARAHAALFGRTTVTLDDASVAAQLVLSPRATCLPAPPEDDESPTSDAPAPPSPEKPETESAREGETKPEPALDERGTPPGIDEVIDAARVAIPPGLLAQLASGESLNRRSTGGGKSGQRAAGLRGRPLGARAGLPRGGARLDLMATLRAAAPWQRLRNVANARFGERRALAIRPADLRVRRFRARTRSVTIFALDASGSAALHRLAEAKGAVELLLSECYVRRDEVAVIAFRDRGAELLLPPTRSLVRCKRSLAEMAGGGGTPLASGIDAGVALAHEVRRRGASPVLVLLTDGRANVALDGSPGRPLAEQQAIAAAAQVRASAIRCLLIDIARRPQEHCDRLAAALGARYLFLPLVNSVALADAVKLATTASRSARDGLAG